MYNRIYKSMLLICTITIITLSTISLLICYGTYKTEANNTFNRNFDNISTLIADSKDSEKALSVLKENDGKYDYEIIKGTVSYNCDSFHHCKMLKLGDSTVVHISIPHFKMYATLYVVISLIIFTGVLLYFLCLRIISALSSNVVKPFDDMLSLDTDNTYAEILPLTRAIKYRNEEIKRQEKTAQELETQLQVITDTMNEGFILLDEKGYIRHINDFALKLFRTEQTKEKNQYFSHLYNNDTFVSTVEQALSSQRTNSIIEIGDSYYRLYCSPIMREALQGGVIILLFDVTNTYQSEKLRREFSANVSHELKTPLTSINGYAQLIANGIAVSSDVPEFAGKIAKESNRLMMLIEDIMRLSNLDEGAPPEKSDTFDIKELLEDILASLQEKAQKRNISTKCEGSNFTLTANKTQISELFYNICDNAIKYNKDNGSIEVTISENTVTVSDSGIGIAPEHTERIFERFFRVDKSHSKKVDGTGLGLSIVKHIAKQNNIKIEVKSKIGEGSKFSIKF